jgi:hypothetical protein
MESIERESKSHSAPAGGVSAYALPFLAKMAMMADRPDKSIDRYLLTHSADELIIDYSRFHKSVASQTLSPSSFFFPQRNIAGSRVAWLTAAGS